jgi:copper chaperone
MKALKFKTNIKCGNCIAAVTPHLNGLTKVENWEVDLQTADKILTVNTDSDLGNEEVIQSLEKAGYKAEAL